MEGSRPRTLAFPFSQQTELALLTERGKLGFTLIVVFNLRNAATL